MIDFKLNYQASVFIDAQQIRATPLHIANLMNLFLDRELLPNSFQEINEIGIHKSFSLQSSNREWKISFLYPRILIEKNPIDTKGNNLGEHNDFCAEAIDIFKKIFEYLPQKACRLSIASSFLLKEMSDIQFNKLYNELFKAPTIYQNNHPFEWDWRSVALIEKDFQQSTEKFNFITEIKRITGELNTGDQRETLERVRLSFDINSHQKNLANRFDLSSVVYFLEKAPVWYSNLLTEIIKFIEPCL